MFRKVLVNGMLNLAVLAVCLAAVIGVVWAVNSLFHYSLPNPTIPDRLILSLTIPFAVVLFAMLLEQTCRVVGASESSPTEPTTNQVRRRPQRLRLLARRNAMPSRSRWTR